MSADIYKITLVSDKHYGRRIPPDVLAPALAQIPAAVRESISMAFRGQSAFRGPRPQWLKAASDIRFVEHSGCDESILYFEVPKLGDAAPELYLEHRRGHPS